MKLTKVALLIFCLLGFSFFAQSLSPSLERYNSSLPYWGVSWAPGNEALKGYYPSFYTGFAIRSEYPERIHVRLARGNQTRVSVILDDQTLFDYLYDLKKREDFYQKVTHSFSGRKPLVRLYEDRGSDYLKQVEAFSQVLQSSEINLSTFIQSPDALNPQALYAKSLEILQTLNPGRVFLINLDLTQEFIKWKTFVKQQTAGISDLQSFYAQNEPASLLALNTLVLGRTHYLQKPDAALIKNLADTATLALEGQDEKFVFAAYELFKILTENRYDFRVLSPSTGFVNALNCESMQNCTLTYPEFTAIYPTGTVKSLTRDDFGNTINDFATPGLWQFLSRDYHEMDHIRDEPFYGWAPKMDYEGIGNGFHNPAVHFADLSTSTKDVFGIPKSHSTLWAVKRGRVSSGCARLPLGHVWEMRHIFPVENSKMTKIAFFGNNSTDFDVYDVDGDGTPEVMGVEYFISYDLKGNGGLEKREGVNLEVNMDQKLAFYKDLYGPKNIFRSQGDQVYLFENPKISVHSYQDFQQKRVKTRYELKGEYALFEQKYEKDKVQFYLPQTTSGLTAKGQNPLSKRIVRLMGRVRGCSPLSDKTQCGEQAFDQEYQHILNEIK